ncbi:MAG: HAD-IA family hydrolase [Gammaproteobacteria bacterium]|nr:HAD-IA family hydrolase [Gammaproteobacteria bacterium]NIR96686.1 HAD-IA family hydrolase [Gammaproteobacteria bacterium]NIT62390.1 HAD-IA family hydrolase [Gammaproteobacteria bacterium]NIV19322.1 HAD-IA family hydrolase [Gammaproteobacteria bacterium]NIX10283.1 HAD-IA family hydrolase [Gammaproteobacteria bacterium]
MSDRYRLLIFDWDGTLMDSEVHIVASMQAAMGELGLEVLPRETVRNVIGLGLREAICTLFPDNDGEAFVSEFARRYRRRYMAPDRPLALFAGVANTLRQLHRRGYLLSVATGKSRRGLDRSLAESGLGELFRASRSAEETASKPDPRMLHEILAELGAEPQQTLMVGDTEFDLEMASRAGMRSVAVSYGVHAAERLWRHRPLACLDSLRQLPALLSSWEEAPGPGVQPVPQSFLVKGFDHG